MFSMRTPILQLAHSQIKSCCCIKNAVLKYVKCCLQRLPTGELRLLGHRKKHYIMPYRNIWVVFCKLIQREKFALLCATNFLFWNSKSGSLGCSHDLDCTVVKSLRARVKASKYYFQYNVRAKLKASKHYFQYNVPLPNFLRWNSIGYQHRVFFEVTCRPSLFGRCISCLYLMQVMAEPISKVLKPLSELRMLIFLLLSPTANSYQKQKENSHAMTECWMLSYLHFCLHNTENKSLRAHKTGSLKFQDRPHLQQWHADSWDISDEATYLVLMPLASRHSFDYL